MNRQAEIEEILKDNMFIGTFQTKEGTKITMDKSLRTETAKAILASERKMLEGLRDTMKCKKGQAQTINFFMKNWKDMMNKIDTLLKEME